MTCTVTARQLHRILRSKIGPRKIVSFRSLSKSYHFRVLYRGFVNELFEAIQISGDADIQQIIIAIRSGSSTTDVHRVVTHLLVVNNFFRPLSVIPSNTAMLSQVKAKSCRVGNRDQPRIIYRNDYYAENT
jgi:hypothetical protein